MNAFRGLTVFTAVWVLISVATGQEPTVYRSQQSATKQASREDLMQKLRILAGRAEAATPPPTARTKISSPNVPVAGIQQVVFEAEAQRPSVPKDKTEPPFLDLTTDSRQPQRAQPAEPSDTDLLIRFGTWTVIILCCCGLTVLAIRRWQRNRGMLPETNSHSRVLETVALGPNRSVSLVQMRDVRAIVGCDGTGVSSIVLAPESFEHSLEEMEPADGPAQEDRAA